MTPTTLPGLLAAELDAIDSDSDAARRAAELLRVLAERFPDTFDTRGYRAVLIDAADDLEGSADIMDERRERDLAEDAARRREPYLAEV